MRSARSLAWAALLLVSTTGCYSLDIVADNRATQNKLNVFITNVAENQVYASITKVEPGTQQTDNVLLTGDVEDQFKVIATLNTPDGNSAAREELIANFLDVDRIEVIAHDNTTIGIVGFGESSAFNPLSMRSWLNVLLE